MGWVWGWVSVPRVQGAEQVVFGRLMAVPSQRGVKLSWGGKGGCGGGLQPSLGGPHPTRGECGAAKTSTAST